MGRNGRLLLQHSYKIVPAEVDEAEFWRRYFFWENQINENQGENKCSNDEEKGQKRMVDSESTPQSADSEPKTDNSTSSDPQGKESNIESPAQAVNKEESSESWTVLEEPSREKNGCVVDDDVDEKDGGGTDEAETNVEAVGSGEEDGDGWDEWE